MKPKGVLSDAVMQSEVYTRPPHSGFNSAYSRVIVFSTAVMPDKSDRDISISGSLMRLGCLRLRRREETEW